MGFIYNSTQHAPAQPTTIYGCSNKTTSDRSYLRSGIHNRVLVPWSKTCKKLKQFHQKSRGCIMHHWLVRKCEENLNHPSIIAEFPRPYHNSSTTRPEEPIPPPCSPERSSVPSVGALPSPSLSQQHPPPPRPARTPSNHRKTAHQPIIPTGVTASPLENVSSTTQDTPRMQLNSPPPAPAHARAPRPAVAASHDRHTSRPPTNDATLWQSTRPTPRCWG